MRTLGSWQLIRRLGSGGTAEVFLAHRSGEGAGGRRVALKVLLPHLAEDPAHVSMIRREAKAAATLSHPNIAGLLELGEAEGRPFLAMEFVSGAPLNLVLRALREKGQRVSRSAAAYLVREAALGLHHAHEQQLIHRDVSPHNLMVARDGAVKVVDFGLARATHEGATTTGGLKGKLRYMPPEQLRSQALDRRADVFALGAVLWELALGQPLYPGPTEAEIFQQALFGAPCHPDEVSLGLPRAFVNVLVASVARERDKRLPTAQALADALFPLVEPGAAAEWAALLAQGPLPEDGPAEPSRIGPRPPVPTDPAVPTLDPETDAPRAAPALQAMPRVSARANRLRQGAAAEEAAAAPAPGKAAKKAPDRRSVERRWAVAPGLRLPRTRWYRRVMVAGLAVLAAMAVLIHHRLNEGPRAAEPDLPAPVAEVEVKVEAALPAPPRSPPPSKEGGPRRGGRGTLVLTASSPAFVRSGELDLGLTPVTVQLPAGRHALVLQSADGTRGAKVEVDVPRGGTVETRVTLQPR